MEAQLQRESPNFYNELANIPESVSESTPIDIMTYNSSTFKPQSDLKTQAEKDKYSNFLTEKRAVM